MAKAKDSALLAEEERDKAKKLLGKLQRILPQNANMNKRTSEV